jgi:DNA-binding response OmpR family regulator
MPLTGKRNLIVDLYLNPVKREVTRLGETVALTAREHAVLAVLMAEPGRLVTRAELETHVYGAASEANRNRLEVHIHNLRRKLGPGWIANVKGRGYRILDGGHRS